MTTDIRTEAEFRSAVVSRYIPALLNLATHNGEQYSGGDSPALINFYEGSNLSEDTPEHYLMNLATKQWHVLCNWSLDGTQPAARKREIVQRVMDIITYMLLLLFMIEGKGDIKLPGDDGYEG